MPFGIDDLQYGDDFGNQEFGSGGAGYTGLDTNAQYGGYVYDEYLEDTIVSDEVDVADYLYTYDPLKEQNLLADYMSGLVDMGDKTEGIRQKAIAERKALSRGIRGGLTTGTMMDMEQESMDAASRAQAGLYRGQASAKRQLGEQIGSLREAYESDIAQGVLDYNEAVGDSEGVTYGEQASNPIDSVITHYADYFGVDDPGGSKVHAIVSGAPSGDYAIRNSNVYGDVGDDDHGDTWLDKDTGKYYKYKDPHGIWGRGDWHYQHNWRDEM